MRTRFAALAAVLALALTLWTLMPSRPRAVDAPATSFSAMRAFSHVEAIASEPHPSGSEGDRKAIVYLAHRLAGMGLRVAIDRGPVDDAARAKYRQWSGSDMPADAAFTSLIGLLPGRDPTLPAIVLMAHHDSVWASPGAADDGIGVSTILETVRAIRAGPPPARSVVVLFTDGEELSLGGAKHIFANPRLQGQIGAALNFEARGGGGRVVMFETGRDNGAMMGLFARAVPWPFANSLAVTVYRMMPNSTDLTPALKTGVFGFNFAIVGDAWAYHSPLATPERLDLGSLQDMGQQALGLTRALAMTPTLPARTPDTVFSDLWGSRMILYPAWGGWVLLGLSLAIGVGAMLRVRPCGREAATGALLPAGLVVGTGLLLFVFNWLSGAGAEANYYDRLAALPRLEVQAALICLAVLALLTGWSRLTRWGGWIAMFGLVALIGIVLQIVAPATATPIHWPLLIAAVQMAIAAWLDPELERPSALAPIALLSAGGAGEVLALGHFLFLDVGAGMAPIALLPLLATVLLFWPLACGLLPLRRARTVAIVALVAAVVLALWVRLDAVAPSVPPYIDAKH